MKTKILALAGCCALLITNYSFGQCSKCGSFGNEVPSYSVNCCPFDTPCQCTDPGWKWNTCIDKCTYCEAFGNVGAR